MRRGLVGGGRRAVGPRGPGVSGAVLAAVALACALAAAPAQAKWLVPMDDRQTDHLKAYGLTYWVLQQGQKAEWLLNYRAGSFLLPDDPAIEREANVRGVALEPMGGGAEAAMRAEIADNNMEAVGLEAHLRDADLVITRGITANWGTQGPGADRFYAFDKKTGALVWASSPGAPPKDNSFSHPQLGWYQGRRG